MLRVSLMRMCLLWEKIFHPRTVFLSLIIANLGFISSATFNRSEYAALKTLYDSTNGPQWGYGSCGGVFWNFSQQDTNPCDPPWCGITCNKANSSVEYISLAQYGLNGYLPDNLFNNLTMLEKFDIYTNSVGGTIPQSIKGLYHLGYLDLSYNKLQGTIPSFMGHLKNLTTLYLELNKLTGTIPQSICESPKLATFFMYANSIGGTIPDCIGNVATLQYFYVAINKIVGTIPSSIGKLSNMKGLYTFDNFLNGTVPEGISNMSSLRALQLNANQLTGTLPLSFSVLKSLNSFLISNNNLEGTIPDMFYGFDSLSALLLNNNQFAGTIPPSIANISDLKYLYLFNNKLEGTIPSLSSLKNLGTLLINNNSFTGNLNFLTENNHRLEVLSIDRNNFMGTIPTCIATFDNLQYLLLSKNSLYGHLPSFENLNSLEVVSFASNNFDGGLPNFSSSVLELMDFSENSFTGEIPPSYFEIPSLVTFSASKNCLSQVLPSTLCDSTSIQSLFMSGLYGSSNCKLGLDSHLHYRTIPDCLWSSSSLQQLHLCGNGYYGTISSFQLPSITKLNVASNRIVGDIPSSMNNIVIEQFDLSYNMISGTLEVNIYPKDSNSTFVVDNNRLSGPLNVDVLREFSTVDVLQGNIFSCGKDLPANDERVEFYKCGSEMFYISFCTWSVVTFLFISLLCYLYYSYRHDFSYTLKQWVDETLSNVLQKSNAYVTEFPYTTRVVSSLRKLLYLSASLTIIILVLSIILYCSYKIGPSANEFKTHSYEYGYNISGLYLRGIEPSVSLMLFHMFYVACALFIIFRVFMTDWMTSAVFSSKEDARLTFSVKNQNLNILRGFDFLHVAYVFFAFMIFIGTSLLGNFGYILILDDVNDVVLFLAQVGLMLFNETCKLLIPYFTSHLFEDQSNAAAYTVSFLIPFVTISVPIVTTMLATDLCFRSLLFGRDAKSTSQSIEICIIKNPWDNSCGEYYRDDSVINFIPPFVYSGQCRNALLNAFIPVIIMTSLYEAVIDPLMFVFTTEYLENRNISVRFRMLLNYIRHWYLNERHQMVIHVSEIWTSILCLLTFGVLCPAAGFIIGICVISKTFVLEMKICRYFSQQIVGVCVESNILPALSNNIEVLCKNVRMSMNKIIWPGLIIAEAFFALVLLDMAFDVNSANPDLGAPISVFVLTLLTTPVARTVMKYFESILIKRLEFVHDSILSDHEKHKEISMTTVNPINGAQETTEDSFSKSKDTDK